MLSCFNFVCFAFQVSNLASYAPALRPRTSLVPWGTLVPNYGVLFVTFVRDNHRVQYLLWSMLTCVLGFTIATFSMQYLQCETECARSQERSAIFESKFSTCSNSTSINKRCTSSQGHCRGHDKAFFFAAYLKSWVIVDERRIFASDLIEFTKKIYKSKTQKRLSASCLTTLT